MNKITATAEAAIDAKKEMYWKVLNVFENDSGSPMTDYSTLYLYADGPGDKRQITIGRGITEFGNMKALLMKYKELKGKYAPQFESFLPSVGVKQLYQNDSFKKLLVLASKEDQKFRDAEDAIFEQKYYVPACKFFYDNGFTQPLSMMILLDSFLHSGSIPGFLRKRFTENVPAAGGNEKEWMKQYVAVRHKWLATHTRKILRNTVYRTKFLQEHIDKNNWAFNCPLKPNGVKVC